MRSFVIMGLLASVAIIPAGSAVDAQSSDSAVAPGLSIAAAAAGQTVAGRRSGGMRSTRGGHGTRGTRGGSSRSTSISNSNSSSNSTSNSRSNSSSRSINRTRINVGGSRSVSRSGGSRSISRSGGSTTNVRVNGGTYRGGGRGNGGSWGGGGNWNGGGYGSGSWGGGGHSGGTRFVVGGFLPTYFLAPRYYLTDYPAYGLSQPGAGNRWVRYYDDAYLVDDRGYVSDYRYGVPYGGGYEEGYYDRDDGYYGRDEGYYEDDRYGYNDRSVERRYCDADGQRSGGAGAAVGAVAGGVLGGVAGNLIAGRGDRTEGTIIGAGVGAIAGGVAGAAIERGRYDRDRDCYYREQEYREDVEYRYDDRVPEYVGEGQYYPENRGCEYRCEAQAGYDFDHPPQASYRRDYHAQPHPAPYPMYQQQPVRTEVYLSGGVPRVTTQASGGIAQNATTTIVIGNSAPATTTTTTVVEEEYEYATPQRSYRSKRLRR